MDVVGFVHEVQDERIFLAGAGAVEARERLHGLDAIKPLVHVHRVQKRLIEAGLVFLGHKQQLVLFGRELVWQFLLPYRPAGLVAVHIRLGVAHARRIRVFHGAGECDQRLYFGVALLLDLLRFFEMEDAIAVRRKTSGGGRAPGVSGRRGELCPSVCPMVNGDQLAQKGKP